MLKALRGKARGVTEPALATVRRAIVVNDELAAFSDETLLFYLNGIFDEPDAVTLALRELASHKAADTFAAVDQRLRSMLSRPLPFSFKSRMADAFARHEASTAINRRAYSPVGRVNPNTVFWPDPRDSSGRSLYTELPFAKRFPLLDKQTPVVSAGSCFAMEIAHALQRGGYNYLIKERNKDVTDGYEMVGHGDLVNASAAWGIIFNTPSFRQLVEKAFEVRSLPKLLWTMDVAGRKRFLDPFREDVAFDSVEAFETNYEKHIAAARDAFTEMKVFIITLGLNEVWYFKADGSVFSRSPWRTAPSLVAHRTMTVEENVADLMRMTEILRAHNPSVSIICTLSPVPLHATFRGDEEHVVTANAHSKAVLRVAAEEFTRRCPNTYYFPSYEVVTTSTEHPWSADQRHVSREAVLKVMNLFHMMFDC